MPRQDDPAYEQPEEHEEEEEDVSSEEYSDDSEEKTAEFSYKKNDLIMPGGEYEDTVFLIEKASKAIGKRVEIQLAPLAVQLHDTWEDEEDHPWKDLSFFIHRNEAAAGRRAYVAERKRLDELAGTARAPPAARALSAAAQQRQQAAAAASAVSEVQQVYFLLSTASSPSGLDKDQKVGEIFANYSAPRRIFEAMGDPADRTFGSQACSSASRWCRAVNTTFEEALRCGNATLRVRPGSLGVLIAASGTAKPKFTAVGSPEVFKALHKLGPLVVTLSVISSDPSDAESSTPQQQVLPSVQCPDVPLAALRTSEPLSAGHGAGGEAAPAPGQRPAAATRRAEASTMRPDPEYNKFCTMAIRMLRSTGGSALGSRCSKTLLYASQQDSYARGGGPPPDGEPQVKSTTFRYMLHCMMRGLDRDKTCARIWDESSVTMRRWDEPPENDRGQESWAPGTMPAGVTWRLLFKERETARMAASQRGGPARLFDPSSSRRDDESRRGRSRKRRRDSADSSCSSERGRRSSRKRSKSKKKKKRRRRRRSSSSSSRRPRRRRARSRSPPPRARSRSPPPRERSRSPPPRARSRSPPPRARAVPAPLADQVMRIFAREAANGNTPFNITRSAEAADGNTPFTFSRPAPDAWRAPSRTAPQPRSRPPERVFWSFAEGGAPSDGGSSTEEEEAGLDVAF